MKAWEEVEHAYKEGRAIKGIILDRVKGGLAVDVGFAPLCRAPSWTCSPFATCGRSGPGSGDESHQGQPEARRTSCSPERPASKRRSPSRRSAFSKPPKGSAPLKGVVKNLTDYGAFVDLGGLDGLLHVTDMSWKRINHPSEMFQVGDQIEVLVLNFDEENGKLQLGYKTERSFALEERDRSLPHRQQGQGQGHLVDQLRRLRGARARHRGPDPRLRDVLVQEGQAPLRRPERGRYGRSDHPGHRPRRTAHPPSASSRPSPTPGISSPRPSREGDHVKGKVRQHHRLPVFSWKSWRAWTAWCTSPTSPGSVSTIPARS